MNEKIENYRRNAFGETERSCPRCGEWAVADHVDNGIGMERCGPYYCEACGWVEARTSSMFHAEHQPRPAMPTKTCPRCNQEKPLSAFSTRPNGSRFSHCKSCRVVTDCANRREQRRIQREDLAENALHILADGPKTAREIADRIGNVTTAAVALALAAVPAHVTKHTQPHGSAIYTVTGAAPPQRTPRSHAPSLYDPWAGIDDEHREWMHRYRAQYAERQGRIAQREIERAK